jgi:hypothetical protein
MQLATYVKSSGNASFDFADNQTAKSAAAHQIRQAAFFIAEARRRLKLAQRTCGCSATWAAIEACAVVSHRLLTRLEEL